MKQKSPTCTCHFKVHPNRYRPCLPRLNFLDATASLHWTRPCLVDCAVGNTTVVPISTTLFLSTFFDTSLTLGVCLSLHSSCASHPLLSQHARQVSLNRPSESTKLLTPCYQICRCSCYRRRSYWTGCCEASSPNCRSILVNPLISLTCSGWSIMDDH